MGYDVKTSPAIAFQLKTAYKKIIYPFEEYVSRVKQAPSPPSPRSASPQKRARSPADSLSPLTSPAGDQSEHLRRMPHLNSRTENGTADMQSPLTADRSGQSAIKLDGEFVH